VLIVYQQTPEDADIDNCMRVVEKYVLDVSALHEDAERQRTRVTNTAAKDPLSPSSSVGSDYEV